MSKVSFSAIGSVRGFRDPEIDTVEIRFRKPFTFRLNEDGIFTPEMDTPGPIDVVFPAKMELPAPRSEDAQNSIEHWAFEVIEPYFLGLFIVTKGSYEDFRASLQFGIRECFHSWLRLLCDSSSCESSSD